MKSQAGIRKQISADEIAYLAYIAWEKEGCPNGRDVNYWLEVEVQLKATRHLLQRECGLTAFRHRASRTMEEIQELSFR